MSIRYLKSIFESASGASENNGDWDSAERQLNTELPDDYKVYINNFGSAYVDKFLTIYNPFSQNPNLNLIEQTKIILEDYRWLQAQGNEQIPFPLFPDKDGLLPFGTTDNGDVLFWKTSGEPNQWTIVVNASRESLYDRFDENMTDFLTKILRRELVCAIFPADFPSSSPTIENAVR